VIDIIILIYYYLILFNIRYNAYVVIELKTTEFKVEYIAQVQKYMNYNV
jgi:predicted nuclease of restriction endonuclease-like (RecB) superfamily